MLQNKDISKVQEIKTLFEDKWLSSLSLYSNLNLFYFKGNSKLLNSIKRKGIDVWDILNLLLIMPFTGNTSINSLFTCKMPPALHGGKDIYYRLLANQNFNWRSLLFIFVKRYLELESKFTPSSNSPRCLIFDDTDIPKRGKTIEGISKIFNHVSHNFIFGYKLLLAGYWNGTLFIPVDFSFHRESKKKNYELNAKQRKAQKTTKRDRGSAVIKRYNELNLKKSDVLIQMCKRVK